MNLNEINQIISPLQSLTISNNSSMSSSPFDSSPSPTPSILGYNNIWSPTYHGRAITKRNLEHELNKCSINNGPMFEYRKEQQQINYNQFQSLPILNIHQQQLQLHCFSDQTIQYLQTLQQKHNYHQQQQQQQNNNYDDEDDKLSDFFSKEKKDTRQLPIRSEKVDLSDFIKEAEKQRLLNGKRLNCSFCLNNNESEEVYSSHNLKDALGRIICPILRKYECQICHTSGDYAHTTKYCPILQKKSKLNKIKKFSNTL